MAINCTQYDDERFYEYWNKGIAENNAAHPFYSPIVREFDHLYFDKELVSDDIFFVG